MLIVTRFDKSIFVKLTSRADPQKSWGVHPLVMTVNYLTTLTENRGNATIGGEKRGDQLQIKPPASISVLKALLG